MMTVNASARKSLFCRGFTFKAKGVALITVLLIVALAAIVTTEMTARLQMQMQRNHNLFTSQQAYWYAMGAEAFAKRVLANSVIKDKETHLDQAWAQGESSFPVENGTITGEITDLQSCFNLNALKNKAEVVEGSPSKVSAKQSFIDLIIALKIDNVGQFEAEYMADALTDWIDSDSIISSLGGAEDNDYSAKEFSYLPANDLLTSVNELRIIESFTPQVIVALKPHVCIIPEMSTQMINVNTLNREQPELLQALLGIDSEDAKAILAEIPQKGFKDIEEFTQLEDITKNSKITKEHLEVFVVGSDYFQLKASANFDNSYVWLTSVLKISDKNKINIISRKIGRD